MLINRIDTIQKKWAGLKNEIFTKSILPRYLKKFTIPLTELNRVSTYCLVFKIKTHTGIDIFSLHKIYRVGKLNSSTSYKGYEYFVLESLDLVNTPKLQAKPKYMSTSNYKITHWVLEEKHYEILKGYWLSYSKN